MDYTKICFVIMPFGEKETLDEKGKIRTVNFDAVVRHDLRSGDS